MRNNGKDEGNPDNIIHQFKKNIEKALAAKGTAGAFLIYIGQRQLKPFLSYVTKWRSYYRIIEMCWVEKTFPQLKTFLLMCYKKD